MTELYLYNISRKIGYKHLRHIPEAGVRGLDRRSDRAQSCPHCTSAKTTFPSEKRGMSYRVTSPENGVERGIPIPGQI